MRKLVHFIYYAIWLLLFKLKNFICTYVLHLKLIANNVTYGTSLKAVNGVPLIYIHNKAFKCRLGNNVTLRSCLDVCWNSKINIIVKRNAALIIGDNTGISGSLIYCSESIEIGNNVMIGGGCRIFDTDFHPISVAKRLDPKTINEGKSAPIYIEDNVFIGTNCIIGKGVRIGKGSVLAAGSVVVKSISANEIWGGNPAKFIRKID